MKNRYLILLVAVLIYGCRPNPPKSSFSLSPEAGTSYKLGDDVKIKLHYTADIKPDSIVYLADSTRIGSKKDSSEIVLKTASLTLGPKTITARIFTAGKSHDESSNIVLLAPKAPEEYTYQVEKVYPHDTGSFTEGLLYHDGFLYESTGQPGHSKLLKVNLATGKPVQTAKLDTQYFGEGSAIIGDKIIMLTYQDPRFLFVFDKNTFKLEKTLPYHVGVEGWGLTFDGQKLYTDDSTNRIWFLDKDSYRQIGFVDVYDDKGPINAINELEYIDGKLYANIWEKNDIVVIDPRTGIVLQHIDMTNLYPESKRNPGADVLNGIAYDKATGRVFLTGKKWDKLFQVKFVKK